jgi:hypothetical protein
MLNQSLSTVTGTKTPAAAGVTPDQFGAITGYAGLVATEFSYKKDEEIYGEDEPAEYVYQVISGAVRSYKLLSDGRRQIGAFHLPADVFGLESGATHRLAAEAIIDTTVRLVKRRSLEQAAGSQVNRRASPCRRPHAAARTQDGNGTRRDFPDGDGSQARGHRDDGAADVPPGYRGLSRIDAGNGIACAFATPRPGCSGIFRRPSDPAPQPQPAAQYGILRVTALSIERFVAFPASAGQL